MKRKELLGLGIIESDLRTTSPSFEIYVYHGTRKDDLFVSSPLIRRIIRDYNLIEGQKIGNLSARIGGGVLAFGEYFPIGRNTQIQRELFEGTETARYIESKILKKLRKYHEIKKIKTTNPEEPRIKQIKKLGYTEKQVREQKLNFKTYLKRLTSKTASLIKRTRRR